MMTGDSKLGLWLARSVHPNSDFNLIPIGLAHMRRKALPAVPLIGPVSAETEIRVGQVRSVRIHGRLRPKS